MGASLDNSLSDKASIISVVCEKLSIYNINQAVMVGDRKYDISGANAHQMDSIGVLYGFGNLDEFQEAGASYVVNSVDELKQMFIFLKEDEE